MPSGVLDEEDYASSQDSDFVADNASAHQPDSDDDAGETTRKKQRRDAAIDEQYAGYDNSGDEAIVRKGRRRQNRAQDGSSNGLALDGGEGGLIKTRRQRAEEKAERAAVANFGPDTIDVDAVWEQMISGKVPIPEAQPDDPKDDDSPSSDEKETNEQPEAASTPTIAEDNSDTIRIKRTYTFAGRTHTEEKLVPRDSAEAKLYLASGGTPTAAADNEPPPRATRKAFRSAFDPYLNVGAARNDLDLGLAARPQAAAQAKKLNTVEKSRMDWASFVDKEGIQEELEVSSKAKGSYNAREAFLARSEAVREEEARRARMAGRM